MSEITQKPEENEVVKRGNKEKYSHILAKWTEGENVEKT